MRLSVRRAQLTYIFARNQAGCCNNFNVQVERDKNVCLFAFGQLTYTKSITQTQPANSQCLRREYERSRSRHVHGTCSWYDVVVSLDIKNSVRSPIKTYCSTRYTTATTELDYPQKKNDRSHSNRYCRLLL